MGRNVVQLLHIILILSQLVFALIPYYCFKRGEAVNINFIVFGLTQAQVITLQGGLTQAQVITLQGGLTQAQVITLQGGLTQVQVITLQGGLTQAQVITLQCNHYTTDSVKKGLTKIDNGIAKQNLFKDEQKLTGKANVAQFKKIHNTVALLNIKC
jgi:hypothetical protein